MEHAPKVSKRNRKPRARPEASPIEPPPEAPTIGAQEAPRTAQPPPDRSVVEAAALLGVSMDATATQLRAALRARLSSSRIHPDHGGDGEADKNLLVGRARSHSGSRQCRFGSGTRGGDRCRRTRIKRLGGSTSPRRGALTEPTLCPEAAAQFLPRRLVRGKYLVRSNNQGNFVP